MGAVDNPKAAIARYELVSTFLIVISGGFEAQNKHVREPSLTSKVSCSPPHSIEQKYST